LTEPVTTNIALIIPNTGDLPGVWGANAVNPDFAAIDGWLGGVQTISVSNSNITLTAPSGSITPTGGPTQSQNAVLSFTGTLTGNVQITLPLPGSYIVENLTTGNFVLSFAAANSGQVIAVDQGEQLHIYNNGTNVRFVNLGRVGHTEIWAGLSAIPAWVTACTVPPYLLCDGSIYNFTTYPYLGKRLNSQFGGNGITTFGVPDLRGRVQLPYDGTGTRITTAVSGLNGQTIGAAGGDQNIQQHTHTFNGAAGTVNVTASTNVLAGQSSPGVPNTGGNVTGVSSVTASNPLLTSSGIFTPSGTNTNFGAGASQNVQPSQVTGIAVIRAA
jgi:microcystin-dependent protein